MNWSVLAGRQKKGMVTVCILPAVEAGVQFIFSRMVIWGMACVKDCFNVAHDCIPQTVLECLMYFLKQGSLELLQQAVWQA